MKNLLLSLFLFALSTQILAETDPTFPSQEKLIMGKKSTGITLSEAISLGLRNNFAISSAYLERVAQKFDLTVAEDRFTPKLQFSSRWITGKNENDIYKEQNLTPSATLLSPVGTKFSLSWTKYDSLTHGNNNGYRNDGVTFSVIQPLLKGAGYNITTAPRTIARLNEKINKLNLKMTVSDTITSIIVVYRSLLQAQERLILANESLKRSVQILEINKRLLTAGRMAEIDIIQTQADVAMQELAVRNARTEVYSRKLDLLKILNLSFKENIYASDRPEGEYLNINPEIAFHKAQEMQPDYISRLLAIRIAEMDLKVVENNQLWDVSLIGSVSHQRNRNSSIDREYSGRDKYIGLQIDIPLNDLSLKQDEIRAKINLQQRKMTAEDVKRELEKKVYEGIMEAESRWEEFILSSKARDLSLKKVEAEKKKLLLGRSSNFQVLSYENDLRNTENSRLNALISYLNTLSELDKTLGTTLYSWGIIIND